MGVPEVQFNCVLQADETLTVEELEDRLAFLQTVYECEYSRVQYTWNLIPESTWNMYILLGHYDLKEQVQLRECKKALKNVWKTKYGKAARAAKRKAEAERKADQEDPVGECVRPEQ